MKIGSVYYCNICGAEIPAGEDTHEFTSMLISDPSQKGHCHDDCLGDLADVLKQFSDIYGALSTLLDPALPNVSKSAKASRVEIRHGGEPLKRVPPRRIVAAPRASRKRRARGKKV